MFNWNEASDATLTAMRLSGISSTEIGKALGCTKGAVIGRAKRIGLPRIQQASSSSNGRPRVVREKVVRLGRVRLSPLVIEATPMPVAPLNVPFMEWNEITQCSNVEGTGADGLAIYCGHPRKEHSSYCQHHSAAFEYFAPPKRPSYFVNRGRAA